MSGLALQAQPKPLQPSKPERKLKITRVVRTAIDLMVWEGLKREDAAIKAGMKDNSLYVALRRPDVKAYYLSECEVLRTSGRARRLHRLEEMAEQNDNKQAAVNAILAIERLAPGDEAARTATNSLPGLQIVVIQAGSAAPSVQSTIGTTLTQHDPLTIENDDIST